ncbi:MAG TPA: nuclear transport factor 2 family protein [Acidimicrobiia bacterium]|jgi:hypothetical protein|nr:nuclear transport factor 2 family protein [Acidimicrobiia bacterium]
MRIALTLVLVVAASCNGSSRSGSSTGSATGGGGSGSGARPSQPPPPPSRTPLAPKLLAAIGDALSSHDAKRYAALFAPDGISRRVPLRDDVGRDAIAAGAQTLLDAFPDLRVGFARAWQVSDDTYVATWAWTGTNTGSLAGAKPTNRRAGTDGVAIATFTADDQLRELDLLADGATVAAQLSGSAPEGSFRAPPDVPSSINVVAPLADDADTLAAIKPLYVALDAKREADVLAFFTEQSVFDDKTAPRSAIGITTAKNLFDGYLATFPDFTQLPLDHQWCVGGYVISAGTLRGTYKPANQRVALHFVDIIEAKSSKVAELQTFSNSLELQAQLSR